MLDYEALQHGEIRLLAVSRNEQDGASEDRIKRHDLTLSFTTISAIADQVLPYTAISYVWGDGRDTLEWPYAGGSIRMTRNLYAILDNLASSPAFFDGRPRYLWIDAICINQDSLMERAIQVPLMDRVFSRAASVLVFLSTDPSRFEVGVSYLTEVATHPEAHYQPHLEPHITVHDDLTALSPKVQDSIIAFFAVPWWTRVWTVQEFILASDKVLFRCGDLQIEANTVLQAFGSLRDHEANCCWSAVRDANGHSKGFLNTPSAANGGLSLFEATLRLDQLLLDPIDHRDLLALLSTFRSRQCTDPRDHIYGLLGLTLGEADTELRSLIPLNYSIQPARLTKTLLAQ